MVSRLESIGYQLGDTHVENTSNKRLLLLIETDTAGSLNVGILNVQVACSCMIGQMRVFQFRENMSSIPEDILRV